ncbi:MAG TPA: aldo/keto reductase [Candidatus Limnocylindrales bacterium]|jgi:D-threo-aldose 1-dehydrogenase|nr:aldo/keto reductase [Candidatus Limnocylindrales bacterium]
MPYEPTDRAAIGATGVEVTRLGLGAASIGGLFRAVADGDAIDLVRHAWDLGIRFFDVAPLYGYGAGERRLGAGLAGRSRDDFTLSTKVGRLVRRVGQIPDDADVDPQAVDGRTDAYYADVGDRRVVFDYSYDGVLRSVDESLERLGVDRIDILLVHDPDGHERAAIDGSFPALVRLREEGVVRAIGAGMNQAPMLARFVRDQGLDVVLVAGRYTLLDQAALAELLPLCLERRVAVLVGGAMNSGVLADPRPGSAFDYRPAPGPVVERARRLAEACGRHGVPLKAAAVQFPLAHPAVVSLVAGVRRIDHLDEYPALMRHPIPDDLWQELRDEGLIPRDAPVPTQPAPP